MLVVMVVNWWCFAMDSSSLRFVVDGNCLTVVPEVLVGVDRR